MNTGEEGRLRADLCTGAVKSRRDAARLRARGGAKGRVSTSLVQSTGGGRGGEPWAKEEPHTAPQTPPQERLRALWKRVFPWDEAGKRTQVVTPNRRKRGRQVLWLED